MRYTRDIWVQIVGQFLQSGLTQEEFPKQRGIPVGTLRSWIYKLRGEESKAADLLPVRVIASPALPARGGGDQPAPVEVELESVRLRFPSGTAAGVIAEVVALLRARC